MRKLVLTFVMTLCLLATFTVSASAHSSIAVHHVSLVVPLARGGGCDPNPKRSLSGDIHDLKACISYSSGGLNPDAYVSFNTSGSSHGALTNCTVGIDIYDAKTGSLVEAGPRIDCFSSASRNTQNKRYFGYIHDTKSGNYYTYAFVLLHYKDGTINSANSTSPTENL